jgi:hypothetical protein
MRPSFLGTQILESLSSVICASLATILAESRSGSRLSPTLVPWVTDKSLKHYPRRPRSQKVLGIDEYDDPHHPLLRRCPLLHWSTSAKRNRRCSDLRKPRSFPCYFCFVHPTKRADVALMHCTELQCAVMCSNTL